MSAETRARSSKRAGVLLAKEGSTSIRGLVSEMAASFVRAQEHAGAEGGDVPVTSEPLSPRIPSGVLLVFQQAINQLIVEGH